MRSQRRRTRQLQLPVLYHRTEQGDCFAVPDRRLDQLSLIVEPQRVQSAIVEFTDIAGLVKGASKGEGLGNQFLSHIRETSAIVHVVRCFESETIIHVDGTVDPLRISRSSIQNWSLPIFRHLRIKYHALTNRPKG